MLKQLQAKLDSEHLTVFSRMIARIEEHEDARENLRTALGSYEAVIESEIKRNEFFDKVQARNLMDLSIKILNLCDENPREPFVPWALAAIAYFILTPDGNDDFASLDGLDDDQKILQTVVEVFSLKI